MQRKISRKRGWALPVLIAGAWSLSTQSVAAAEFITRADWPAVPSGSAIVQIPALQRVMRQFQGKEQGVIFIRYPGGDRGSQWAEELREWLVALGVSSRRIILEPGSGAPDSIALAVGERRR